VKLNKQFAAAFLFHILNRSCTRFKQLVVFEWSFDGLRERKQQKAGKDYIMLHQILLGWSNQVYEMGGACSTNRRGEKRIQILVENKNKQTTWKIWE